MKKELTGLLFDNDGVLIDSMPGALRAWVKWGEVYHPGFALTPEFHGRRASDIVKDMVTPEEFQASYDYINLLEIAESASTRPLPGTLEFLAQLPAGHWNIVTGANPCQGPAGCSRNPDAGNTRYCLRCKERQA